MKLLNPHNVWRADNLPDGLTIKDGVISGVPTVRGSFNVNVSVSNELGSSSKVIRIITKNKNDITILKNGSIFETITPAQLQSSIQDGTAQSKYNCTTTQMLIDITHPKTGAVVTDVALNFCSFRNVTLEGGTTKPGLILQFAHTLWKGFAPFTTNSFNRWRYSQLRRWLNSSGSDWVTQSYTTDILTPHEGSYTDYGVKGFLSCLPSALAEVISPVKVVTQAFFDDYNEDSAIDDPDFIDGFDADITYDKIFVPSVSEMAIEAGGDEFFPEAGFEGSAWQFYSALSEHSGLAQDLDGSQTSIITRSAYLDGTTKILYAGSSSSAVTGNAYNADSAPAPAFVIC